MARPILITACIVCASLTLCAQPIPEDVNPQKTRHGLTWSVLKKGEGRQAVMGDKVWLRYSGWLTDGKVFDTGGNDEKGREIELVPGKVTPGWMIGIQMMHVGDVLKLTVPPELGYGNQPQPNVPANSTLIYKLELLDARPHLKLPAFAKLDEATSKKTASGLRFAVLDPGSGKAPGLDDLVIVRYALWNEAGDFVECNRTSNDGPISFVPRTIRTPFFKEALAMMRPGSRMRFDAPPELVFGGRPYGPLLPPDSRTVWELELVQTIGFELPKDSELKSTESGIKYKVVTEGTGRQPKASDKVRVHYAGWLLDGTRFDSSYERRRPTEFPLGGVIKGWTEGLQLMKEGGTTIFVIPAGLAYGDKPQAKIPANSTLCFRINLIKILDK